MTTPDPTAAEEGLSDRVVLGTEDRHRLAACWNHDDGSHKPARWDEVLWIVERIFASLTADLRAEVERLRSTIAFREREYQRARAEAAEAKVADLTEVARLAEASEAGWRKEADLLAEKAERLKEEKADWKATAEHNHRNAIAQMDKFEQQYRLRVAAEATVAEVNRRLALVAGEMSAAAYLTLFTALERPSNGCPACGLPVESPGEGRFCGHCQDHEGHCRNDHCMTCGETT